MRNLLLIATALLVCVGVIAVSSDRAVAAGRGSPPIPWVGFSDDYGMYASPNPAQPAQTVQMAEAVGLDAERITVQWSPTQSTDLESQLVCNAAVQDSLAGFKAFVFTITPIAKTYPSGNGLAAYWKSIDTYFSALFDPVTGCVSGNYVTPDGQHVPKLAQLYVEPDNEPNIRTFCGPQTDTDHYHCASLTVALRQYLYPLIKQAGVQYGVNMVVVGGALSSHHDPFGYIAAECKAMKAQGITSPNMDLFDFHPYPLPGSSDPTSGMLMHDQLVDAIQQCYHRPVLIAYFEYGVQTIVPIDLGYTCGNQPPGALSDTHRAWDYKLALSLARKQAVVGLLFYQLVDDQCMNGGWRSGFYYWNAKIKPLVVGTTGIQQAVQAAQSYLSNQPGLKSIRQTYGPPSGSLPLTIAAGSAEFFYTYITRSAYPVYNQEYPKDVSST